MAGPACRVLRAHDRVRINGTERSERRRAAIPSIQPHRRNARFASGLPPIERPPTNRRFWFVLLLIVAVSLSGPLWLPYTGVTLPASVLVITSIISCAFAVVVFILSWRDWSKKV